MVTAAEAALALAGGLAASETTGVTNLTGIGGGSEDGGDGPTPGGGGVLDGLPPVQLPEVAAPSVDLTVPSNAGNAAGSGVVAAVNALAGGVEDARNTAEDAQRTAETAVTVAQAADGSGDGVTVPTGARGAWNRLMNGSGSSNGGGGGDTRGGDLTEREAAALATGRDPFDLQVQDTGPLGTAASALEAGGEGFGNVAGGTGEFASENPYFVAGTGIGAVSPDPITTAGGAAAGGVVEVGADTLTGGTPLGVESPIDVTSGGAWWQGPDPLNLGGDDGGDPDGTADESRDGDGGGMGPEIAGIPAIGPALTDDGGEESDRGEPADRTGSTGNTGGESSPSGDVVDAGTVKLTGSPGNVSVAGSGSSNADRGSGSGETPDDAERDDRRTVPTSGHTQGRVGVVR